MTPKEKAFIDATPTVGSLIRIAVRDLSAAQAAGYRYDPSIFYLPNKKLIDAGGSIICMTLTQRNDDKDDRCVPSDFCDLVKKRLYTVSSMGTGSLEYALANYCKCVLPKRFPEVPALPHSLSVINDIWAMHEGMTDEMATLWLLMAEFLDDLGLKCPSS